MFLCRYKLNFLVHDMTAASTGYAPARSSVKVPLFFVPWALTDVAAYFIPSFWMNPFIIGVL